MCNAEVPMVCSSSNTRFILQLQNEWSFYFCWSAVGNKTRSSFSFLIFSFCPICHFLVFSPTFKKNKQTKNKRHCRFLNKHKREVRGPKTATNFFLFIVFTYKKLFSVPFWRQCTVCSLVHFFLNIAITSNKREQQTASSKWEKVGTGGMKCDRVAYISPIFPFFYLIWRTLCLICRCSFFSFPWFPS